MSTLSNSICRSLLGFQIEDIIEHSDIINKKDSILYEIRNDTKYQELRLALIIANNYLSEELLNIAEPLTGEQIVMLSRAKEQLKLAISRAKANESTTRINTPDSPTQSPLAILAAAAREEEEKELDEEENGKQNSHNEKDSYRINIEKITGHRWRSDKNKRNNTEVKFVCAWEGFKIETEETLESAMKAERALAEYLENKVSKRGLTTLLKRHPNLGTILKK